MISGGGNLEWLAHSQNREWVSKNNFRKGWINEPDYHGKNCDFFIGEEGSLCLYYDGSVKGGFTGYISYWIREHQPDLAEKVEQFIKTTSLADFDDKVETMNEEIVSTAEKVLKENSITADKVYAGMEQDGKVELQVYINGKKAHQVYSQLKKVLKVFYQE